MKVFIANLVKQYLRWYHTRCIALNRAEINDALDEKAEAWQLGDRDTYLAIVHWIDGCQASIRHHEERLVWLGAVDPDSHPPTER